MCEHGLGRIAWRVIDSTLYHCEGASVPSFVSDTLCTVGEN
jgi:hypothetical protein